MTSYRGVEAIDWFGFSRLWSLTVGYAKTTSRIDSQNRRKTLIKYTNIGHGKGGTDYGNKYI